MPEEVGQESTKNLLESEHDFRTGRNRVSEEVGQESTKNLRHANPSTSGQFLLRGRVGAKHTGTVRHDALPRATGPVLSGLRHSLAKHPP